MMGSTLDVITNDSSLKSDLLRLNMLVDKFWSFLIMGMAKQGKKYWSAIFLGFVQTIRALLVSHKLGLHVKITLDFNIQSFKEAGCHRSHLEFTVNQNTNGSFEGCLAYSE